MAYTKYTWTDGEVINAQKLNHMEDGIEDAGSGGSGCTFVVKPDHQEGDVTYYDKTWQELADAMESGQACLLWMKETHSQDDFMISLIPINACGYITNDLGYVAIAWDALKQIHYSFIADSADAYLHGDDEK